MTAARSFRSFWRASIRWKVVAALVAVSVLPMLVTSQIAASAVSATYTENVESWLFQIARFFAASVEGNGEDAEPVIRNLTESKRLDRLVSGTGRPARTEEETRSLDALGYDVLVVQAPDGRTLYANRPVDELRTLPFEHGGTIFLFRGGGKTLLATGRRARAQTSAGPVDVFVGQFLDASFIENIETIGSLGLTLFYRFDDGFRPLYASLPGEAAPLDAALAARLARVPPGSFLDAPDSGEGGSIGIYVPIEAAGQLVAVIACSLHLKVGGLQLTGSHGLLLVIFATGLAMAVIVGILLSGFVTRRVGRLAEGVDAVAKGDFGQRIPVRGEDELDRLAIAFNTMSAQLQDYRQLQSRLRRKERFATLGEVAAGFAHEVRNPLGIIKTTAELVQRSARLDEKDARRLGYVADEVRRIDRLIRDFLVFARPAQRTVTVRPAELVERVLGFCASEIEARGVDLRLADESGDTALHVDLDQMVQALLNLVLNALDALDANPAGARRLALRVAQGAEGEGVSFALADNGPGIPADLLERVFDPFVTTKPNGTGLGLATVFAIAESHGGWIEARNGENGGAVFELTLPAKEPASAAGDRDPRADAPHHPDR